MIVVPDTNVFIHCNWIKDLPWECLADHVRVIIPHTVIQEIDTLKRDANSRRAKRARATSNLLREINAAAGRRLLIGKGGHHSIEIGTGARAQLDGVFQQNNDDEMLAEAGYFLSLSTKVAVLTDDDIVLIKAPRWGLDPIAVPEDWLLPPEQSTKDRQLSELAGRVAALESRAPRFEVSVESIHDGGKRDSTIMIQSGDLPTRAEIDLIVAEASQVYPPDLEWKDKVPTEALVRYPSSYEFEVYESTHYPAWQSEVSDWALERSRTLLRRMRSASIVLSLENVGPVPADGLILDVHASAGVLILPVAADDRTTLRLPRIPPRPAGPQPKRLDQMFDAFAGHRFPDLSDFSDLAGRKDRHAFYEISDKRGELPTRSFEREELRHKDPGEIMLALMFEENFNSSNVDIAGRISCRNLPIPWEFGISLEVSVIQTDSLFDRVLRSIRRHQQKDVTQRLS